MKRIALSIHSHKHPDIIFLGYALSNEVGPQSVSFFSTVKFQPDEELEIRVEQHGEVMRYHVTMTQLHEQISSGRIMNAVPDADHPYPARTFYRCYTRVREVVGSETTVPEAVVESAPEAPAAIAEVAPVDDLPQAA
jgi:hypothetical protein